MRNTKNIFTFIPDGAKSGRRRLRDQEEYDYNKAFFASLGLKSDSVGRTTVVENKSDKNLFARMLGEAKKSNVRLRVTLDVETVDDDSYSAYIILMKRMEPKHRKVGKRHILVTDAYKYSDAFYATYDCYSGTFGGVIREDVVDFMNKYGGQIHKEEWLPDVGKYDSKQFFYCYTDNSFERNITANVGTTNDLLKKHRQCVIDYLSLFSNWAEEIINNTPQYCSFEYLDTPYIADEKDIEGKEVFEVGFALGVSKKMRDLLIKNHLMKKSDFEPLITVDNYDMFEKKFDIFSRKEKYYYDDSTYEQGEKTIMEYKDNLYKELLAHKRPKKIITKDMAINKIKDMKSIEPQDFKKGVRGERLEKAAIKSMKPFYRISNGFILENTYRIYSIENQKLGQLEFEEDYAREDKDELPKGYAVIGDTMDGEWLILLPNGQVICYLMGDSYYLEEWDNIFEFLYAPE